MEEEELVFSDPVVQANAAVALPWPMDDDGSLSASDIVWCVLPHLRWPTGVLRADGMRSVRRVEKRIKDLHGLQASDLFAQQESLGCLKLISFLKSSLQSRDPTPSASSPVIAGLVDWEDAFFAPAPSSEHDSPSPLAFLLARLDDYTDKWDAGLTYHSPYAAIVQSSGWGKSRRVCDLRRYGVFVMYCSFMKECSSGYPPRSQGLASCFDREVTEVTVCTYITACLQELQDSPLNAGEWLENQVKSNRKHDVHGAILNRYNMLLSMSTNGTSGALQAAVQSLHRAKAAQLRQGALKVLFAFDEGKSIKNFNTVFPVFRKALAKIPVKSGCFATFSDTSASVSNPSPPRELDPSGRVSLHGQELYDPIHLVGMSDIFAPGPSKLDQGTVNAADHESLFKQGRPLWAVHLVSSKLEKGEEKVQELVKFATWKLAGGASPKNVTVDPLQLPEAAAIFAVCIGSQLVYESYLAQQLVAGFMLTCVATADGRKRIITMPVSEPVLGEAAAFMLQRYSYLIPGLDLLTKLVREGWVLEGVRGELVARIILLLGMHECVSEKSGSLTYTGPVKMCDFLSKLFGDKWDSTKCNSPHLNGLLHFNHFVPVLRDVEITDQKVWDCWCHGAAMFYAPLEYASDMGIPWAKFDPKSNRVIAVGLLEVQVKNCKTFSSGAASDAFLKLKNRELKLFQRKDSPVVIMNLGGMDLYLEQEQNATLVSGLSSDVYPFLEGDVVNGLQTLLKAKTDATVFLPEAELAIVKRMAPLSLV